MRILLGIDLGTTKLCALALDADSGAVLAVETAANDTRLAVADPDAVEQDAQAIGDRARGLLARLGRHAAVTGGEIVGLGVTGQMHGVVIADANGAPLTPLVNWQDQRGNRKAPNGRTYTEAVQALLGADLTRTGCRPATGYGAVTLYRLAQEGRLPHPGVALTIQDWFVLQLTGVAATDPTNAGSWGIFDAQGGADWLPDMAARLGLPARLLPPVLPTGTTAFPLRAGLAGTLGLPTGLPVAVALGDNQASFLGSVPSLADSLLFNLGTGGQISVATRRFATVAPLETRPLLPGLWLLVGASLCGGRAYHLLAQFFAAVGAEFFGTTAELPAIYAAMNRLAERDGDDTLAVSPLFCGTRHAPAARATIRGLGAENFSPEAFTHALVRGMVGELMDYYRAAERAGAAAVTVVGAGNSVRRNAAVRREIARQTGLPLLLPLRQEEAACGAALAAGVATGLYANWRAAGQRIGTTTT